MDVNSAQIGKHQYYKKSYICIQFWKWVSVINTVTRVRSGPSEVRISVQARVFFTKMPGPALGFTNPFILQSDQKVSVHLMFTTQK
jgi:hypothetical protein